MKDKIINELKFFLMIFLMVGGLTHYYVFIWNSFGLPITWWSALLIGVTAGLSELAYLKWVSN